MCIINFLQQGKHKTMGIKTPTAREYCSRKFEVIRWKMMLTFENLNFPCAKITNF